MDLHIIIPRNLHRQSLENLHAAHQGLTGMHAGAKLSLWWPGFNKDLERFMTSCMHCNTRANHSHASHSAQHLAQHTPLSPWWPIISIMVAISTQHSTTDSLAS